MKKKFVIILILLVTTLGVSSCGESKKIVSTDKDIDCVINNYTAGYSTGLSYQRSNSYTNVDGLTYSKGDLLPVYKQIENKLDVNFRDCASYGQTTEGDQYNTLYSSENTKFQVSNGYLDLYSLSMSYVSTLATSGNVVAISDYLDQMPNLKAYFNNNPALFNSLKQADGKVYSAPFTDSLDSVDKCINLNTTWVTKLLDDTETYDTDTVLDTYYEKTINYSENEKIAVVGSDDSKTYIYVSISTSIIDTQNNLLVKNGANMVDALKSYLRKTYGNYIGEGKLYSKLSDIYLSKSACYNTDELIALMRCVKTNPILLANQSSVDVLFTPATSSSDASDTITQFASVFGVNGLSSNYDRLYYDNLGNLCDARTNSKSYEALGYLNNLYNEGLIVKDFSASNATSNYPNLNFLGNKGFMVYDTPYNAALYNQKDSDNLGQANSKSTGIRSVLSPVNYYADQDHTDTTYTRFMNDTKGISQYGFVVPTVSDNINGALKVIDYLYSEEGTNLMNFGPTEYTDGTMEFEGKTIPKVSKTILSRVTNSDMSYGNYYRNYIGACQQIGYPLSAGLVYQYTNAYGKLGLDNLYKAIKANVVETTSISGERYKKSIPVYVFGLTTTEKTHAAENITILTNFWKINAYESGRNLFITKGYKEEDLKKYTDMFTQSNNEYLGAYKVALE